jgi:hypothetical protein
MSDLSPQTGPKRTLICANRGPLANPKPAGENKSPGRLCLGRATGAGLEDQQSGLTIIRLHQHDAFPEN